MLSSKFFCKGRNFSVFIMGVQFQGVEVLLENYVEAFSFLKTFYFLSHKLQFLGSVVNISGISKGKGFCGVIKRYGFSSGNKTHGNSKAHNKPGSIGMCQDPGRVLPGKKMPGRKGNSASFVRNLRVILFKKNKILLLGSVPGCFKSNLFFRK
ncbi:50S ribosomal protein L3 [Candidatus Vidania fulgoroideorum]